MAVKNTNAKKVATTKKATNTAKKAKAPAVSIELDSVGMELLANFRNAKKAETEAKEAKEQAELALREILGDHTEATIQGAVVLKVVPGKNTHFDREMMKEMFPEAFTATLRETLYTWLKTL